MFGLLKFLKKSIKINDSVFGLIEYRDGVWIHSPPDPSGYMLVIDAGEMGPTEIQRDFYRSVARQIATYESMAKSFLKKVDPDVDCEKLEIYSVSLGNKEELARGEFVIEFCDIDADMIHVVSFSQMKPEAYNVED